MNTTYIKLASALAVTLMGLSLYGCKGDDTLEPMQYIGADQITRLTVSPNSPVLVADGNSVLTLNVDAYYAYGTDEEGKPMEHRLLSDRMPLDDITITSSTGETFKAGQTFSTSNAGTGAITFTASLPSGIKSTPVTVTLQDPSEVSNDFPEYTIPVRFVIYYTEADEQGLTRGFTNEFIGKVLERVNKVFNGGITPLPSNGNIHTEFQLIDVKRYLIPEAEASDATADPASFYSQKIMAGQEAADAASVLNIWVLPNSLNNSASVLEPMFTLGDPATIPFPQELYPVNAHSEIPDILSWEFWSEMTPTQMGITISYADFSQALTGSVSGLRLETLIGAFYGLRVPDDSLNSALETEEWLDTDYAPDTYTYRKQAATATNIRKTTYPNPAFNGGQSVTYDSFNVMDVPTPAYGITKSQAVRMRLVMEDIPYRKQATGGDSGDVLPEPEPTDPFDPWGGEGGDPFYGY